MSWRMAIFLGIASACVACARPVEKTGDACTFGTNDVLITEAMVTPTQDAAEWIEVYNNSKRPLLLHRAVVTFDSDTGTSQQWVIDDTREVPTDAYWVIGNKSASHVNSVVSHGAALSAHNLRVSVSCKDLVSNSVGLTQRQTSAQGRSVSFEGFKSPTRFNNSKPEDWCVARSRYSESEFGTPGLANMPCGMTMCRDGTGNVREVRTAVTGALAISEVYRDAPGTDDNREWIEFYNRSNSVLDLNGLILRADSIVDLATSADPRIVSDEYDVRAEQCLSIEPGKFLVLRIASKPSLEFPSDGVTATAIDGVSLRNGKMAMTVLSGADVVTQADLPEAQPGRSDGISDVNAGAPSYCAAHSLGKFGVADAAGNVSERGTPGVLNDPCGEVCREKNGRWRAIAIPRAGELVLTEWYNDPRGSDAGYEWVEFFVDSDRAVDINGVSVKVTNAQSGKSLETILDSEDCLSFDTHRYGVISADNATFPSDVSVVRVAGLSLYNAAGELSLSRYGLELDRVTVPAPIEGASTSLAVGLLSASSNDDVANFCGGRSVGSFKDASGDAYGTPGRANDPCGVQWCLDNGQWRIRNPIAVGGAAISEVYFHASGGNDGQDWLEIVASSGGDLGGFTLTQALNGNAGGRSWSAGDARCLAMRGGDRFVFAGKNSSLNFAQPLVGDDFYATKSSFTLTIDGITVDSANVPKMAADQTWIAGSDSAGAVINDNGGDWCLAVASTPGKENASCVMP